MHQRPSSSLAETSKTMKASGLSGGVTKVPLRFPDGAFPDGAETRYGRKRHTGPATRRVRWSRVMPDPLQLRIARAWKDDQGIIWFRFRPSDSHSLADAREIVAAHIALAEGTDSPVLADLRGTSTGADRDARTYYSSSEGAYLKSAMAMVVDSPVQRMLGNIFLRFNKPPYPTRLLAGPDEAIEWLEQFAG